MHIVNTHYILVTTEKRLKEKVKTIRQNVICEPQLPYIGVDVEFYVPDSTVPNADLAPKSISLIQIGGVFRMQRANEYISKVYVFDILALRQAKANLSPLKECLQDENIFKVFHDCRSDCAVLYQQLGIKMKGIIDTQLAYEITNAQPDAGINAVLSKFGPKGSENKWKDSMKQGMIADSAMWAKRPLNNDQIRYAAADVTYLVPAALAMKEKMNSSQFEALRKKGDERFYIGKSMALACSVAPTAQSAEQSGEGVPIVLEESSSTDPNEHLLQRDPVEEEHSEEEKLEELKTDAVLQQGNEVDFQLFMDVLPEFARDALSELEEGISGLMELVLDVGRPMKARVISSDGSLRDHKFAKELSIEDIDAVVRKINRFGSDLRTGIDRTLHRISAIHNRDAQIIGLTMRVGRMVKANLRLIRDLVDSDKNILLLGKPGVGKTTLLRQISKRLAESKRVIIIDTSCEIAGNGDVPHAAIGEARRMQVPDINEQFRVMIQAVQNHTPEVIVVDEMGTQEEAEAAATISQRGVRCIGTAHGEFVENLFRNAQLATLVGGFETVTVGDQQARLRALQSGKPDEIKKTVIERKTLPVFDVVCEIRDPNTVIIYDSVAAAVDSYLLGKSPIGERRELLSSGNIKKQYVRRVVASAPRRFE